MNFGRFDATGSLGAAYAPFDPERRRRPAEGHAAVAAAGSPRRSPASAGRARPRRSGACRARPPSTAWTASASRRSTPSSAASAEAFDLSREDPRVVARYDTAPLVRPENIDRKWNNYNNYVDNAESLGKLLLLARRLCERGCGFVTVTTNFVWDMHADVNNAAGRRGHGLHGPAARSRRCPRSSKTCAARGLSEQILLVVLRRDGTHAADQQQRRPRSLGQSGAAAAGRRRPAHGPGHRPIEPQRRRAATRRRSASRT